MKPIQQIFALVLEQLPAFKKVKGFTLRKWYLELDNLKKKHPQNYKDKETALRNKEVKLLLFSKYLIVTNNLQNNNNSILKFI